MHLRAREDVDWKMKGKDKVELFGPNSTQNLNSSTHPSAVYTLLCWLDAHWSWEAPISWKHNYSTINKEAEEDLCKAKSEGPEGSLSRRLGTNHGVCSGFLDLKTTSQNRGLYVKMKTRVLLNGDLAGWGTQNEAHWLHWPLDLGSNLIQNYLTVTWWHLKRSYF